MLLALRALAGAAAGGIMPLTLAWSAMRCRCRAARWRSAGCWSSPSSGRSPAAHWPGRCGPLIGRRGILLLCSGLAATAAAVMLLIPIGGPPDAPRRRFDPVRALRRYRFILSLPQARILYFAVAVEGVLVFGTFPYFAPMLEARGLGGPLGATAEAGWRCAAFGAAASSMRRWPSRCSG